MLRIKIKSKCNTRGSEISVWQSGNRHALWMIEQQQKQQITLGKEIQNGGRIEIEKKMIYGLMKTKNMVITTGK